MNTIPCGQCEFYDPILKSNEKESKRGWCIRRSVYPANPGPGQVFPEGAVRADDPKAIAKPYIVRRDVIVDACAFAKPGQNQAARKKAAQVKKDKAGRRVLE